MPDIGQLIGVQGTEQSDSQDTITLTYRVQYTDVPTNFYTALSRGRSASGTPLPARRSLYASPTAILYADTFSAGTAFSSESRAVWEWTVGFKVPEPGDLEAYQYANPLDRPPVYNVSYMDREDVIDKAKNVEALSHGDGAGGNRAANTEGPIVNAAGKRPDEPLVDTTRLEVLVIQKNYPSLASIVTRNRQFKKTTNSDTVQGYGARELRYLLTESLGVQYENGVEFWPGVTTILADTTHDLVLDNVGYEYWDTVASDWKRATDADGNFMAEPVNLTLAGDEGGTNATTITYRYLEDKAYASLFV